MRQTTAFEHGVPAATVCGVNAALLARWAVHVSGVSVPVRDLRTTFFTVSRFFVSS